MKKEKTETWKTALLRLEGIWTDSPYDFENVRNEFDRVHSETGEIRFLNAPAVVRPME
ncbi:MAG: hypothetical protein WCJ84_04965 [Candidatus Peregrinibacteria bacterium]